MLTKWYQMLGQSCLRMPMHLSTLYFLLQCRGSLVAVLHWSRKLHS